MKNKRLPNAGHLLVALKNSLPAVLLLGLLSLASAPAANAQIVVSTPTYDVADISNFSVSSDITITLGTTYIETDQLKLTITNATWSAGAAFPSIITASDGGTAGLLSTDDTSVIYQITSTVVGFGSSFTLGVSNLLVSGTTSPVNIFASASTSGGDIIDNGALNASGAVLLGTTASAPSAVPEPSSFAAVAGFAILGLAGFRRRRTTSSSV